MEPQPTEEIEIEEEQQHPEIQHFNFAFRPNVELGDLYTTEAVLGDITQRDSDIIVSPANSSLLRDAASDAIHAACSPESAMLETALLRQFELHGSRHIPEGMVITTNAYGDLAERVQCLQFFLSCPVKLFQLSYSSCCCSTR